MEQKEHTHTKTKSTSPLCRVGMNERLHDEKTTIKGKAKKKKKRKEKKAKMERNKTDDDVPVRSSRRADAVECGRCFQHRRPF